MDTEKQRQGRRDDSRLSESRDARSEQLLVMPTESLLTNGEWLPGELFSGSERRTPGWFLDMNIRLVFVVLFCFLFACLFVCLFVCLFFAWCIGFDNSPYRHS